ncbi:MAG: hypothetical protein IJP14_00460 [Clostridia bacterium]|nr:hypothetical protein [Clostridia bacterium]
MKQMGKLCEIKATIDTCRAQCAAANIPFHADALAAALGIPYDTLIRYTVGRGETARLLKAAVQECTASVIGYALTADPKSHGLWMFYLRNRVGFADKGDVRTPSTESPVRFVGEERIE